MQKDRSMAESSMVHQIKITLEDIRPLIWRRVLASSHITLPKLHRLIQVVMGWQDSICTLFALEERPTGLLTRNLTT